ncbi:MAG: hypothetical protein ACRECY_18125, partial [Phyllobacterium sp.]
HSQTWGITSKEGTMRIVAAICSLVVLQTMFVQHAFGAEKHFAEATETNEQLMKLYDQAGDLCLHNPSRDVQVAVACKSLTIYGLALNERGWCYGKQDEANAVKKWHECGKNSDHFSESTLTEF